MENLLCKSTSNRISKSLSGLKSPRAREPKNAICRTPSASSAGRIELSVEMIASFSWPEFSTESENLQRPPLYQPPLLHRRRDKAREQRVRGGCREEWLYQNRAEVT